MIGRHKHKKFYEKHDVLNVCSYFIGRRRSPSFFKPVASAAAVHFLKSRTKTVPSDALAPTLSPREFQQTCHTRGTILINFIIKIS
jgi:hypothetical protein